MANLKDGMYHPPDDAPDGCTMRHLCNAFLTVKQAKLSVGDLSPQAFRDYYRTCEGLIAYFGRDRRVDDLRPEDFAGFRNMLPKQRNPVSLGNEINRARVVFKFAHDNRLVKERVAFGKSFARPSARSLRRIRNEAGPKLFSREQIIAMLNAADVQLRAMILLGLNCGFGNTDCGTLPLKALDEPGWVNHPRPKTEIPRRVPLWTETEEALQSATATRPKPADPEASKLVFLTKCGQPWVRVKTKGDDPRHFVPLQALGQAFGKLLSKCSLRFPALSRSQPTSWRRSRRGISLSKYLKPIPKGVRTPQFTSRVLTPQRTRKGPDPFWDRLLKPVRSRSRTF